MASLNISVHSRNCLICTKRLLSDKKLGTFYFFKGYKRKRRIILMVSDNTWYHLTFFFHLGHLLKPRWLYLLLHWESNLIYFHCNLDSHYMCWFLVGGSTLACLGKKLHRGFSCLWLISFRICSISVFYRNRVFSESWYIRLTNQNQTIKDMLYL